MTPLEKHYRDAAAKASSWAERAEAAGRLEDAATLEALASAAKEKADRVDADESRKPAALRADRDPDPITSCALCGSPGVRLPGMPLIACSNSRCIRYGMPVAESVF